MNLENKNMKNNIFISTSCRYGKLVQPEPYHHLIHHTHNTKEFIQYVQYIKGDLDIPIHLQSKVFRSQFQKSRRNQPLINIDRRRLLQEYNHSNFIIIEICSSKIYQQDGVYLHHLAVDGGDGCKKSNNYQGNFQIQTDQELHDDLKIIKQITSDKRLIVATHINPLKFPKRSLLINTLSRYCQDLKIDFHDASKIIGAKDVDDANHLNEKGHMIQTQTLHRILR
jgi:hypothetical protein